MNMILNQLLSNFMSGKFKQQMDMFNQMMNGKDTQQQFQTIFNMAKSRGFDVNKKIFSEQDLQSIGISIPRKSDFNVSSQQTSDVI